MFARNTLFLTCLLLPLAACKTSEKKGEPDDPPTTQSEESGGEATLTPGGDCVLNVNPQNTLPGPSFAVGYDLDGNETVTDGKDNYSFELDSKYDTLQIGKAGGSDRPTLAKNVAYALRIADFNGTPSATVYEINDPFGTQETVTWGQANTSQYKTSDFTIIVESYTDGTTDYVRLIVTTGSNALYFDVNETSP